MTRLALTAPLLAQSDFEREAKDRAAIEKLMWTYTRALDTYNPDTYAATFTPDGQFGAGPNATKGREALHKMVAGLRQHNLDAKAKGENPPAMYHTSMNEYLEFIDKDHAVLRAYWTTTFAGAKRGDTAPPAR